jgi:DNA-binding LytR/AlgR family response regulator
MKVLIIEDEQLAQEELVRLISKNFPQMIIVEIIDSVKNSVDWLLNNSADLIFMDVHLSDGISFDIFNYLEVRIPIIFITAYERYAIQAFEVNGVGYLLKPIDEQKLISAVDRFQKNKQLTNYNMSELLNQLRNPGNVYKSRIAIKLGDKLSFVNIVDVAYFYVEDRFTFLMQKNGKKYIVDYTIETLESMLDPMNFFRLTRGCIASISSIDKVSKYFNSRLKVILKPKFEKEVLISRIKVQEFVNWLDGQS